MLESKFVRYIVCLFVVIPAKAGIQKHLIFLDSGSLSLSLPSTLIGGLIGRNDI